MRVQPEAGGRGDRDVAPRQPHHQRRDLLQRRHRHGRLVWPDTAGRQSGEGGVETFFGHQVALGAFADVSENALDDLPIVWATTPAREMGHTLADRIMQRIEKSDVQAGHQIVSARLVPVK
ncbi:DNA-binding transcriptional repressor MalI [Leclercia adecarboxylata]|uniref:DNA-binding transcriptional repressor MalI n=1 Tax=Leclercia adecarboxylata TaxID=83655 RepID=A0A4U9HSY4_9ENTR|nr:DNA-binding transcriptional repressor MalI [Leclercia adecarboxylata]